jgi:hypothetical protein
MALDFPASPTIGQQFTAAGVTWVWDGTKWTASGLSVAYLPLAGGTMSGPIVLAADPAANLQAATKQYVDGGRLGDNRLINGDMRIDQRNNGASGTATGYTVDRWAYGASQASKGTWRRNTNSPAAPGGFPYGWLFTSSSAFVSAAADYFQLYQPIEGDMISDFQWGTASAQPVTLSFWAYSSLTGVFSGCLSNDVSTRSYPFSYSIPVANTWTRITVTIPGDTSGAWVLSGNALGAQLHFDLGSGSNYRAAANAWTSAGVVGVTGSVSVVGTNSAIWLITGVKLEIGSLATAYNRQSLAKSLADCQRYFQSFPRLFVGGYTTAAQNTFGCYSLPVAMRVAPTAAFGTINYVNASGLTANNTGTQYLEMYVVTTATGPCNVTFPVTLSAEL